jgi:hypothetical protein
LGDDDRVRVQIESDANLSRNTNFHKKITRLQCDHGKGVNVPRHCASGRCSGVIGEVFRSGESNWGRKYGRSIRRGTNDVEHAIAREYRGAVFVY